MRKFSYKNVEILGLTGLGARVSISPPQEEIYGKN